MSTRAKGFDDSVYDSAVMRGLIFQRVWETGVIGFHLEYSDTNGNGVDDWNEDGAGSAIRRVFDLWADVADFTFTETSAQDATLIERIIELPADEDGMITLGRHFLPDGTWTDGEFNSLASSWNDAALQQGGYGFVTLIHEIGHALGLEHPFDDDVFAGVSDTYDRGFFELNQGVYTVMSYDDGWAARGRPSSDDHGYTGTPMALDIAAVQAIYGANTSHATGADSYALRDANEPGTFFSAIWDAGGTDEITYAGTRDAFVFLGEATIDDGPTGGGLISYVEGIDGGYTIARGAVIENASTGGGDDFVTGNDADNTLDAGAGRDVVYGMGGDDVIHGGDGDDILIGDYQSVTDFGGVVTPAPPPYAGPDLPDGLSVGDGAASVSRFADHGAPSRALNVSDEFASRSDPDVAGGESAYTVTVTATSSGRLDHFRFDLAEKATVWLDIDGAWQGDGAAGSFDSFLVLRDASGTSVARNDDAASVDRGSNPESANSTRNLDSALMATLDAGTYYAVVGRYSGTSPDGYAAPAAGATYELHVTADAYVPPEPPVLPESGFDQIGYYYETPDFTASQSPLFAQATSAGMSALEKTETVATPEIGGSNVPPTPFHQDLTDQGGDDIGVGLDTAIFAFEDGLEALTPDDGLLV